MKKLRAFLLLILCVGLASCGAGVRALTGIKSPVVETKAAVTSYWKAQNIEHPTYFFRPPSDTLTLYINTLRSFNSDIILFDRSGKQLCYADTDACLPAQISDAKQNIEAHFDACETQEFEFSELLNRLQDADGNTPILPLANAPDYHLIVFWSKFTSKPGRLKKDIADYETLARETNASVQVLYVNTDLLDEYGLETGKKLKFYYGPAKTGFTIRFGEMPFKKT